MTRTREVHPLDLQYTPFCENYLGELPTVDGKCPSCKVTLPGGEWQRVQPHTPGPPPYLGCPWNGPHCTQPRYPRPAYNNPPCNECAQGIDDRHRERMAEQDDDDSTPTDAAPWTDGNAWTDEEQA